MTQRKHILVVDDERDLAELLSYNLKRAGYEVTTVHSGRAALDAVSTANPDLIVLDVMLPELSGTEVASRIRSNPATASVPIVMLTAKGEEVDQIVGLTVGADDYIPKPFSMKVLLARIEAVLRRAGRVSVEQRLITLGPIEINLEMHEVYTNGESIKLTLTEFRLLAALVQANGRVLTRQALMARAMGPGVTVTERTIDVHTFTVATTIGALRAAAAFSEDFGEHSLASQFREGAERMTTAMRRHLWNPEQNRFARNCQLLPDGTYKLDMTCDAANYSVFEFAGISPFDPMVEADMAAAKQRIGIKTDVGGYARYEHDYYHQVERDNIQLVPGNPWIICTLWRAQFIIQRAKSREEMQEALDLLQWCVKRADRSGVLAEQFHPYTGEPISVSPLTWSHATFVIVVVEYLRKLADIGARARAGVAPGIE